MAFLSALRSEDLVINWDSSGNPKQTENGPTLPRDEREWGFRPRSAEERRRKQLVFPQDGKAQ